jgi:hypothetical protein
LGVANFVEEDAVEVKLSLPRKAFKWFMVVAKKGGVSVEKVLEDTLLELYSFKNDLRSIKKFYDVERPLDGSTSLGHVLSYALNLGSTVHRIAEHLLDDLGGGNEYVLNDVKLVQDEPGAYKGVYFEFVARNGSKSVVDYFTLQIQHDGLYLDGVATLNFENVKVAKEALKRLKGAALKVVENEEMRGLEEKLKAVGGGLNIDISREGNVIFLTFMAYANDINFMPKLHQMSDVLRKVCEEAGIEVTSN